MLPWLRPTESSSEPTILHSRVSDSTRFVRRSTMQAYPPLASEKAPMKNSGSSNEDKPLLPLIKRIARQLEKLDTKALLELDARLSDLPYSPAQR